MTENNNENSPGMNLNKENENENTNAAGEDSSEITSPPEENVPEEISRFQEYFNNDVEVNHPKITATLRTFQELRNIDEELTEIEDEKGDLPDKIRSNIEEIERLNKEITEKRQSLSKLEVERTKLNSDNNSFEAKINKYDEQKYNVRSNEEYDEIVKAIEALFEEVKKNEIRLKDIEDIYKMLNTDVEALEISSNESNTELTENQTLLNELDEQYKQEESTLREKRTSLIITLDSQSTALYERINRNYKGEATAIVRKGNCSGCYNSIPPQRVIEIKSAERIFMCQSCGRILIAEELLIP